MKKFMSILFLLMLPVNSVFAAIDGFQDGYIKKVTIAEASKMQDDTYVTIQGHIVKRLTNDTYSFKDSTGVITVEIDHDKWAGVVAGTNDKLELTGEIEKKFNYIKLDVESVKKITK